MCILNSTTSTKCIWLSGQDFTRQEETSGGRQRLEVTEIKVNPQLQGDLLKGIDNKIRKLREELYVLSLVTHSL